MLCMDGFNSCRHSCRYSCRVYGHRLTLDVVDLRGGVASLPSCSVEFKAVILFNCLPTKSRGTSLLKPQLRERWVDTLPTASIGFSIRLTATLTTTLVLYFNTIKKKKKNNTKN